MFFVSFVWSLRQEHEYLMKVFLQFYSLIIADTETIHWTSLDHVHSLLRYHSVVPFPVWLRKHGLVVRKKAGLCVMVVICGCWGAIIVWCFCCSAAKMAVVGLSNTVAIEGIKNNIHCNVIVPTAASRLTEDILPPGGYASLNVMYLTSLAPISALFLLSIAVPLIWFFAVCCELSCVSALLHVDFISW